LIGVQRGEGGEREKGNERKGENKEKKDGNTNALNKTLFTILLGTFSVFVLIVSPTDAVVKWEDCSKAYFQGVLTKGAEGGSINADCLVKMGAGYLKLFYFIYFIILFLSYDSTVYFLFFLYINEEQNNHNSLTTTWYPMIKSVTNPSCSLSPEFACLNTDFHHNKKYR